MATHSSTLAWKIPWTEEPGRLQSMRSRRVRQDWATSLSCIGEGNGNPLQCSCLENPRDRGGWWAMVHRVAKCWTRLKWLSTHACSINNLSYTSATRYTLKNLTSRHYESCIFSFFWYHCKAPRVNKDLHLYSILSHGWQILGNMDFRRGLLSRLGHRAQEGVEILGGPGIHRPSRIVYMLNK